MTYKFQSYCIDLLLAIMNDQLEEAKEAVRNINEITENEDIPEEIVRTAIDFSAFYDNSNDTFKYAIMNLTCPFFGLQDLKFMFKSGELLTKLKQADVTEEDKQVASAFVIDNLSSIDLEDENAGFKINRLILLAGFADDTTSLDILKNVLKRSDA